MEKQQFLTFAPHLYSQLLNDLRDTAVEYQGTQQLRAQLGRTLNKHIKPGHKNTVADIPTEVK